MATPRTAASPPSAPTLLSYLHGFHAGNHADVLKHVVLVNALACLTRKPAGLRYVDTHAGAGLYRLDTPQARQTAEAASGVGRLWQAQDAPAPVAAWLSLLHEHNPGPSLQHYPGSPWFARRLLRAQDRLELCELHPREFSALRGHFAGPRNLVCHEADGFAVSLSLMPPVERRGLVLIDPSYENRGDYDAVVRHVQGLHRRFASGVYLAWWPILDPRQANRMEQAWRDCGLRKVHHFELGLNLPAAERGMRGSVMTVVNPPFGLADGMREALEWLAPRLAADGRGHYRSEVLIGE